MPCDDTEYPKPKAIPVYDAERSSSNTSQEWSLHAGWFKEVEYLFRINKLEDGNPCKHKHPVPDPNDNLTVPEDLSTDIHKFAEDNGFVQYLFKFRRGCLQD